MNQSERKKYEDMLKERLTPHRFKHSLNVADEAVRLAKKYGADAEKAELAGLLHDIMKDAKKPEQLEMIGSNINALEINAPKLWHAMAGAEYLKKVLDIEDEDVLNAVRYHTTARAGMSVLEKVIYLADFTSAERDYDGVERMRKAVKNDIDTAMNEALTFSIECLLSDKSAIHPDTFLAYNENVTERKL